MLVDTLNESFGIKNILILATIFILGVGCEKEDVKIEYNKKLYYLHQNEKNCSISFDKINYNRPNKEITDNKIKQNIIEEVYGYGYTDNPRTICKLNTNFYIYTLTEYNNLDINKNYTLYSDILGAKDNAFKNQHIETLQYYNLINELSIETKNGITIFNRDDINNFIKNGFNISNTDFVKINITHNKYFSIFFKEP
jgi:exonuclease III